MKVLHLIDSGGLYGAEKMLLALVDEQIKQGLEPMILSAGEHGIEEKAIEREAENLNLPILPWRMKPGLNIKDMGKIIRWARCNNYAVMHSHGYKFNILLGLWPRSLRRIPVMTTLHGYVRSPKFTKMWLYETLDRLMLRRLDAVCLVSRAMETEFKSLFRSCRIVKLIPNGVELKALEEQASKPIEEPLYAFLKTHKPVVLGVGRLSDEKGFDRLIQAFDQFLEHWDDAGLIVVGEGRERERLEKMVGEKGLSAKVLMPGYVRNVPSLMRASSMMVIPSRTEGLPISLLEAMSVGTPVVSTAVGAIPQVLNYGENGILVRDSEIESLVEAMNRIATENAAVISMSAKAKTAIWQHYSVRTMARQYAEIYRQIF